MKSWYLTTILAFTGLLSCYSQEINSVNKSQEQLNNKPKEEYSVNKKYDKEGNLIEYDSTYSSFYSSFNSDSVLTDSLMSGFSEFFSQNLPNYNFNQFGEADSLLYSDFIKDDFFESGFFEQNKEILRLMQQMDSVKNEFFNMYSLSPSETDK